MITGVDSIITSIIKQYIDNPTNGVVVVEKAVFLINNPSDSTMPCCRDRLV